MNFMCKGIKKMIAWFLHRAFLCTVTTAEHYPIDRGGALTSLPNFQVKENHKEKKPMLH